MRKTFLRVLRVASLITFWPRGADESFPIFAEKTYVFFGTVRHFCENLFLCQSVHFQKCFHCKFDKILT